MDIVRIHSLHGTVEASVSVCHFIRRVVRRFRAVSNGPPECADTPIS
ncbi:MAG: hypothetical protein ICV80_15465 [Microcoleus sp. T1-bin1]|nr:hypothetical protein [Microcoleus sp. T1-bin1]